MYNGMDLFQIPVIRKGKVTVDMQVGAILLNTQVVDIDPILLLAGFENIDDTEQGSIVHFVHEAAGRFTGNPEPIQNEDNTKDDGNQPVQPDIPGKENETYAYQ